MTLVELKTRKAERVYPSDIIELSAQRYALQSQTGEQVSEHGYVLVRVAGRTLGDVHRVRLLPGKELASPVARRERLLLAQVCHFSVHFPTSSAADPHGCSGSF